MGKNARPRSSVNTVQPPVVYRTSRPQNWRVRNLRGFSSAVAVVAALSCGDSTGPGRRDPGIHFVAGNNAIDTAGADLVQALVVEVRDSSGRLVPAGTVVRFEAVLRPGFHFSYEATVGLLTQQGYGALAAPETDGSGRAAALVRLGTTAGPARIRVEVPTLGFVDTATFTVKPASASRIAVSPRDTVLYAGNSLAVSATVTDIHGNARDDAINWSASGTGVTVTNAGAVTASQSGRYTLTATSAATPGVTGTALLSVVPRFRLAAWNPFEGRIVSGELDGSDRRVLTAVTNGGIGAHPAWIPGTDKIIYSSLDAAQRLYVVNEAGVVSPWMATLPMGMSHQAEPAPTADGNWVFFSAFNSSCGSGGNYCIHRATASGDSPALLAIDYPSRQPAPSPDGSKVAFVRDDFTSGVRVFDLATNTVSAWSVSGTRPSWSPAGSRIAFISNGRIALVNPDGSGLSTLTTTGQAYWGGPIRWSPDGNWIIGHYLDGLALVQVSTGDILPLRSGSITGGSLK